MKNPAQWLRCSGCGRVYRDVGGTLANTRCPDCGKNLVSTGVEMTPYQVEQSTRAEK